MITKALPNHTRRFSLLLLFTLVTSVAHATSYVSAKEMLTRAGLSVDEPDLINYLKTGLPDTVTARPRDRWNLYTFAINELGALKSQFAVPLLRDIVNGDLPEGTLNGILFDIAARRDAGDWEKWRLDRDFFTIEIQCVAAFTLFRIEEEAVLPLLLEFAEEEIQPRLGTPPFYYSYTMVEVFRAIAVLGDNSGIDYLIASLDHYASNTHDSVLHALQSLTRQTFGPEHDTPAPVAQRKIEKWRDWWAKNRNSFEKPDYTYHRPIPEHLANPRSLRDHIDVASRFFPYTEEHSLTLSQSRAWVEENATTQPLELRKIMDDETARPRMRTVAFGHYIRSLPDDKAHAILRDVATQSPVAIIKDNSPDAAFQNTALAIYTQRFPDIADDLSKECVGVPGLVSDSAVMHLIRNHENLPWLVGHIADIASSGQSPLLGRLLTDPDPIGMKAFFHIIENAENSFSAAMAIHGAQKHQLQQHFPDSTKLAYDSWMNDPLVQVVLAEKDPNPHIQRRRLREILDQLNDAHANAQIARDRIYKSLNRFDTADSDELALYRHRIQEYKQHLASTQN